jgi:hypothetical protein
MRSRQSGRWPPGDHPRTGPPPDQPPVQPEWAGAIGDLTAVLARFAPGAVLGEATYTLTALGQAGDQYRAQFAALAITSASSATLILTADTLKGAAPGAGTGMAIIPPRGFAVVNMRGYAWSVYGGNPGDQITIQAFTRPMPPVAMAGPLASDYPAGAIPVDGDSGVTGNAAAVATLPAAAGKTTWITGFEITSAGATAAAVVTVTVAGLTVPMHYVYVTAAGAAIGNQPLIVEFPKPVPASGPNTAITVTLPALGAGNTAAAVTAHGYQL